jgi:hypothetical protein
MTAKTRANLQNDINTFLATNTTGDISAEDLRTVLTNIIDSCVTTQDTSQLVTALGGTSVSITTNIAWTSGTCFERSVSSNVTLTESSRPSAGTERTIVVKLTVSGSPTVTWPAAWAWESGTAPTLVSGLNLIIATTNNGSNVQARHVNPDGGFA